MLEEFERQLVKDAFFQGPAALLEAGMSPEDIRAFLERDDVQTEALALKRELDHHDQLKARAKFYVRRSLHRLVEPALSVLALSLAGPEYLRDPKKGTIMRDSRGNPMLKNAEPTAVQMKAVDTVLHGVGLHDFRINPEPGADNQVHLLFKAAEEPRTVDIEDGSLTEKERVLARERVRTAIDRLAPRLPAARDKFRQEFLDAMKGPARGRTGGRKKKTAAKVAKKKSSASRGKATG